MLRLDLECTVIKKITVLNSRNDFFTLQLLLFVLFLVLEFEFALLFFLLQFLLQPPELDASDQLIDGAECSLAEADENDDASQYNH